MDENGKIRVQMFIDELNSRNASNIISKPFYFKAFHLHAMDKIKAKCK